MGLTRKTTEIQSLFAPLNPRFIYYRQASRHDAHGCCTFDRFWWSASAGAWRGQVFRGDLDAHREQDHAAGLRTRQLPADMPADMPADVL